MGYKLSEGDRRDPEAQVTIYNRISPDAVEDMKRRSFGLDMLLRNEFDSPIPQRSKGKVRPPSAFDTLGYPVRIAEGTYGIRRDALRMLVEDLSYHGETSLPLHQVSDTHLGGEIRRYVIDNGLRHFVSETDNLHVSVDLDSKDKPSHKKASLFYHEAAYQHSPFAAIVINVHNADSGMYHIMGVLSIGEDALFMSRFTPQYTMLIMGSGQSPDSLHASIQKKLEMDKSSLLMYLLTERFLKNRNDAARELASFLVGENRKVHTPLLQY